MNLFSTRVRYPFLTTTLGWLACVAVNAQPAAVAPAQASPTASSPAYDPENNGRWRLNESLSDEFEAAQLDTDKWHIQGTDGEYRSNFIGRAPSQFSTDNVRVEDGRLKLQTRWESDFEFSKKIDRSDKKKRGGRRYENITTAAVISKQQCHYGYMEIRCKAADASITSSFWMTGHRSELDVFEFLGRPAQPYKRHLETELWSSIHDWSKQGENSTWTDRLQLDWRVADDFHTYGVEWDEQYLKFHADGKLVRTVTREQVGEAGWVITNPLWVWVDSETFPWHGIPVAADLPVDYEVEYIRVWQSNQIDGMFHGFEGSIVSQGKETGWWINADSRDNFAVVSDKRASGDKSLKFSHTGPLKQDVVAFAPYGATAIDGGSYIFSMKVWLEPEKSVERIRIVLEEPWLQLKPFDLTEVPARQWVTLTQSFSRPAASGEKDRLRILVGQEDVTGESGTVYIDELSIKPE